MTAGLSLMKSTYACSYKCFVRIWITSRNGNHRCCYSKKKFWIRFDSINKLKKKEMKGIMKIVDPLKESGLLIKGYNQ